MPIDVVFPPSEPKLVIERDCLEFPALVNGKSTRCLVTFELLMERFRARSNAPDEAVRAFNDSRGPIENLAQAQFILGRVTPGSDLVLKSDTLAFKQVNYSESVQNSGDIRL